MLTSLTLLTAHTDATRYCRPCALLQRPVHGSVRTQLQVHAGQCLLVNKNAAKRTHFSHATLPYMGSNLQRVVDVRVRVSANAAGPAPLNSNSSQPTYAESEGVAN